MTRLRKDRFAALALALGVPMLVFSPVVVSAAGGKGAAKAGASHQDGGVRNDPDNVTALSKFMELCTLGNNQYVARDYPAAIEQYKKAIALAPKNALGHYLLAEALLAANNIPEADATLKQAEGMTDERKPGVRAKILFLTAELLDRQKKWPEAKAAWQTYGDYVAKHADAGAPNSAATRVQSIDDMMKLEKASEIVRQRIAAEKDAAPPPSSNDPFGAGKK